MAARTIRDDWGSLMRIPARIHLFAHVRGVYRASVLGALARMFLLFLGSAVVARILIVGLIAVDPNRMGA